MKKITISICFVVALFVFPSAARAQFLVVGCPGGFPLAPFPSINSALPNVTGTCSESVFLYAANNLTLAAPFGQPATINGNVSIDHSQNVFLGGLNVTNPFGDGIDVNSSRGVTLDSCASSGNAGNGLTVGGTSDVAIINFGTFNNNGADGIFVGGNSFVNIGSFGGITDISNNQNAGVGIDRSVFEAFGTHMAGNGQLAIDNKGAGKALIFSFSGVSSTVIENNPKGAVSLQEGSEISIGSVLPSSPNI